MAQRTFDVRDRLVEIDEQVMDGLTPFQRATVNHVGSLYERGRRRVLVADEVGLGKTLVARGVVSKMALLRDSENDNLVKIAYICSNGSIAAQNVEKLAIDGDIKLAPPDASRLSMQHLAIAQERGDKELEKRYIQITPLTPDTSFSITQGTGTMYERALMYAVLCYCEPLSIEIRKQEFKRIMWDYHEGYSEWNWEANVERAISEVSDARAHDPESGWESGYPYDVLEKVLEELEADGAVTIDDIVAYIDGQERSNDIERKIIIALRKAFSKACVEMLDPDFVIMDEFQRFHNLIAGGDTDAALLAKRFLGGDTRVLLLSATPFRMYSTSAELEDGGFGDSYREFLEVMGFLEDGADKCSGSFKEVWGSYAASLQQLSAGEIDIVAIRGKKAAAEDVASDLVARTERQSTGELGAIADNVSHVQSLEVRDGDIRAYLRMRELVSEAGISKGLMQSDYVKSCPFPLSFMGRYKLSQEFRKKVKDNPGLVRGDKAYDDGLLWLRHWDIGSYSKLNVENARFNKLLSDLDEGPGRLERLLWVPASKPYYRVSNKSPYYGVEGFSKTLVFSAWAMVPPALATLLSYEYERRNVESYATATGKRCRYFKDGETSLGDESEDDQALPRRRLRFDATSHNAFLLMYPSRYLAGLVDVANLATDYPQLSDVRATLEARIKSDLNDAFGFNVQASQNRGVDVRNAMEWYVLAAIKLDEKYGFDVLDELLNGEDDDSRQFAERYGSEIAVLSQIAETSKRRVLGELGRCPDDLVEVLAYAAIGSAAVCAMRAYRAYYEPVPARLGFEFGRSFVNRMNTASSTLAVAASMGKREAEAHWKHLLQYSCEGNFQSVLDEYAHINSKRGEGLKALKGLHRSLIGEGDNPSIHGSETRHIVSFPGRGDAQERIKSMPMRTNIASAFMEVSGGSAGVGVVSRQRLRNAFNSPFRPFVLISTSVGQEGLDFHQYCRKICHWNLPSNPIDLEQREGRVNRYKGLSVRQSVASRYGGMHFASTLVWKEMFEKAEEAEGASAACRHSGLLPYWGLSEGEDLKRVERYAYLYPFSKDEGLYKDLMEKVYRYRAVLGQPDQEELLLLIAEYIESGELSYDDLKELFVNLCPYIRQGVIES